VEVDVDLLGGKDVWTGRQILPIRRNILLPSSRLKTTHMTNIDIFTSVRTSKLTLLVEDAIFRLTF
jgi:hypothetical protein